MRWKRIVGIATVLVILIAVTVYLILSTYDYNKFKPFITRVAKDATGRELKLVGDIKVGIGFSPSLEVEDVSLQNASWGTRPELAKIRRLEIQVALLPLIRRSVLVKRLILVEPDILIETDRSGKLNLDFETKKRLESKEIKEKKGLPLENVKLMQIVMKNGRFTYKDARSEKTYVFLVQSLKGSLEGLNSPLQLNLEGTYSGDSFELGGTFGSFNALVDPNQAWALKLTVKAADTKITLDGSIKDVFSAKDMAITVNVAGSSISKVASLVEISDVPDMGPFNIGFKVSDPALKTFIISDLKVALGDSDLGGSAEIRLTRNRPNVKASLSSQNLDLRQLFPVEDREHESEDLPREPKRINVKLFPENPLPLDALKLADVRIKFKAGDVLLPRLAINDLNLDLKLEDGRLMVRPLKAMIGDGRLDARLDLQTRANSPTLGAQLKIDELDLRKMLQKLNLGGTLEGDLDLQLDINGSGRSVAAIMAGLNGKTSLVMGQGRITNRYIHMIGRIFSPTLAHILNPFLEATEYTQTNCIVSGFAIEDGIAQSATLVFDTEDITVLSDGTVNLDTEELDFSLNPVPKEGASKKKIGRTFSLSELAKPFRLSGTFANPSIQLDTRRTARTIGKGAGAALIGPGAFVAALFTSSTGEKDPCPAAKEAVEEWFMSSEDEKSGKKKSPK